MSDSTNKLGDMNKASLDSIRSILDANTVAGTPIETSSGTTIIPISKISVGYASGGVDYAKKDANPGKGNFGGGGGSGLTVTPVAFLVVSPDGAVSVLNVSSSVSSTPADSVSQVVGFLERSPDLLERLKGVIRSNKKDEDNKI